MRGILFKPIRIPGLQHSKPGKPRKPLSLRSAIILAGLSAALAFLLLAGIYITSHVVTFIWTITTKPTPKSVEELPLWTIPVCMLSPVLVFVAFAWRFRLAERLARFIRGGEAQCLTSALQARARSRSNLRFNIAAAPCLS